MKKTRLQSDGVAAAPSPRAGWADAARRMRESNGVAASPPPRAGWADAARRMRAAGDDRLLDPSQSTAFDEQEWEW